MSRSITPATEPVIVRDNDTQPKRLDRVELLDGFYAEREAKAIKIYNKDAVNIFGLNAENVDFDPKPLTLCLQVYLMAFGQGRNAGYEACRTKMTEMMKLCL